MSCSSLPHRSLAVLAVKSSDSAIPAGLSVAATGLRRGFDRSPPFARNQPSAVNASADHVSFDSDGETINWTTADATARQILVLWIG